MDLCKQAWIDSSAQETAEMKARQHCWNPVARLMLLVNSLLHMCCLGIIMTEGIFFLFFPLSTGRLRTARSTKQKVSTNKSCHLIPS